MPEAAFPISSPFPRSIYQLLINKRYEFRKNLRPAEVRLKISRTSAGRFKPRRALGDNIIGTILSQATGHTTFVR